MSLISLKKRLAAAAAAVCMTFSLCSCANDTAYVMTANGEQIAAGVYINLMLTELTNQMYSLYFSGTEITGSYMDQEVDGVKMNEYLENYAYDMCKKLAAVEFRCEELGVTISDEEAEAINDTVNSTWESNEDFYHTMGISKESIKRTESYPYLLQALFNKYYDEGGIEEVSLEEMTDYVNENLLRYKALTFSKDSEDEGAAAKEDCDSYFALIEEGMTMDEVIEKYEEDNAEEEEGETSSTDENSSTTDDSSTDDTSTTDDSSTDDTSTTDDSSTDESSTDDSSTTDESSTDDSSSETEEEAEEEKTESELEAEQYPNEYLSTKDGADGDEFIDFIDGLEVGAIEVYEDDSTYYIIEKLDMSERDGYTEANREGVLSTMKSEDFDAVVEELANALQIVDNTKALERYNALDVYERQTETAEG